MNNQEYVCDPAQKVPLKEKLFFGAADTYGGGAQALVTAVYLVFLTMNGVTPTMAGVIIMIAKIWDAVTDPWMGVISDNTRTKWGRRRPYIFAGGFFVIVSFALLFLPLYGLSSIWLKFIVYLFAFLFYNTVSTVINVPYSSMSTEISTDYKEKTNVNTIRLVFSMVSGAISAGVPILLLEGLSKGTMKVGTFSLLMIFVFGSFYCLPLVLAAVNCKERAPLPAVKSVFTFKSFIKPLKVRAFAYLLLMYLMSYSCMDLISTNIVYFTKFGISLNISSLFLLITIMLSYAAMVPVISALMNKGYPKPYLFRAGIPLYIIGVIALCLYPSSIMPDWPALIVCVVIGIGMSGSQMLPWIIFPDVIDVAELQLHDRPTGSFSGLMTFIRKTTSAIAIGLSGIVLDLTHFKPPVTDDQGIVHEFSQELSAVIGLRMVIMVPIIFFMFFAFYFAKKLKLNPSRSYKIKEFLELQRQDKLNEENMTPEDYAEYLAIKGELFGKE